MTDSEREAERRSMVERQIAARNVTEEAILDAMRTVPRHRFVPPGSRRSAYADRALGLSEGQTISQPFIVARMIQLAGVESGDRVLDVGTGSGYAAAVLGHIADEVVSVEIVPSLARSARRRLAELGYDNVTVVEGQWTELAECDGPFDAIVVAAAAREIPSSLEERLAAGGRLVVPVGDRLGQHLWVVERDGDTMVRSRHEAVAFVPLI